MNTEDLSNIFNLVTTAFENPNAVGHINGMIDEYVGILNKYQIPQEDVPNTVATFALIQGILSKLQENPQGE